MRRAQFRKQRGHSILEVLIAIFMVASAAVMFGAMIPTSTKSGTMVGNHQQASSLVQHKVDQLRAVGFGRLTYNELKNAGIIDTMPTSSPFQFAQVDGLDQIYPSPVGTIAVSDINANLKSVTVTLTWTGSGFRQGNGSVSVTALIARG